MAKTYLVNGKVYIGRQFEDRTLVLEKGKLTVLEAGCDTADGIIFDAKGLKVVPGFIDVHSHGAVGVDVNAATAEDLEKICVFMAGNGTTAWQCSVLTDTQEQTEWCIEQVKQHAKLEQKGADLLGIHLEGPFLSPDYKGAMPEHLLKKNDIDLIRHYQTLAEGKIRYITLSPELEGAIDIFPQLLELGIVIGIGHTGAIYDVAMKAIAEGATVGTHTGNAMRLFHQHEPAVFGAVMESDVYCETICDGRHLVPGTVRLFAKCKGLDRIVAITDSIMAAGLPDGFYRLGVNKVVVKDGDAKLVDNGSRAGSTLTQNVALKNMLAWLPHTLEEILPTLSENPAKAMGCFDRKGSIETGKDADLVLLDEQANVVHVFARGIQVK